VTKVLKFFYEFPSLPSNRGPGNLPAIPLIGSLKDGQAMGAKPTKEAANALTLAKRARRLAATLGDPDDVARLLRYALELEAQAAELQRRAKGG
jgi:hypothetical protein